jgi:hypothetical protein
MGKLPIAKMTIRRLSYYGACDSSIGNTEVCPKPSAPTLPPAGGTYIDPAFGTEILRVTDRNNGGDQNYHSYSFWNPFNANNTRFFIRSAGHGAQLFSFDPVNFTSQRIGNLWNGINLEWFSLCWSNSNPDILYGLKYKSQKLYQYEPDTGIYILIKDFSGILPPGDLTFLTKSSNDRWFSFIVGQQDYNSGVIGAYDKLTDTVYQYDFNATYGLTNIHSATIDKSGENVWINPNMNSDKYLWTIVTGKVEGLAYDSSSVRAKGHRAMGTQTVYHSDEWYGSAIIKRDLNDAQNWSHIFEPPGGPDWTQAVHLSVNHSDESTIFVSSYFKTPQTATRPYQDEIFQVWTDGSSMIKVRRLAHHRSAHNSYWTQPRAASSHDGKFVMFDSNWDGSGRLDVFILKIPEEFRAEPTPTPNPTDTTPPETTITTGMPEFTASSDVTIGYAGTDDVSPEGSLEFSYSVDIGTWSEWTTFTSASITGLADGPHIFEVKARDEAGNEDPAPASVSFTVDTTPPELTLNQPNPSILWPPNGQMVPVVFSGSAVDTGSGLDTLTYTMVDEYGEFGSAGAITTEPTGGFSFTLSLEADRKNDESKDRIYTLTVTAVDMVGNTTEKTVTVRVPHKNEG